jgi:hypothetical protein
MLKLTHAEDLQIFLAKNWNFLLDEVHVLLKYSKYSTNTFGSVSSYRIYLTIVNIGKG